MQWAKDLPDVPDTLDEFSPEQSQQLQQEFQSFLLYAMDSAVISGTLRFTGRINGHKIQVLLDDGSDNFLQLKVTKFLKLPILPIPPFKILVGNGNALQVEGLISKLQVTIQNTALQMDVYVLPITGTYLILSALWLATLGPHIADYINLSIQFVCDNQLVTLNGDTTLKPHLTLVHQLNRLCSTKAIDACYTLSI